MVLIPDSSELPNPSRRLAKGPRTFRQGSTARTALLLAGLVALVACGGSPQPGPAAPDAETAARTAEQQQRLHDLEVQLEALERQSEAIRREVVSRLDQLDVTREALAVQISNLRNGVGGAVAAAPGVAPGPSEPPAAVQPAPSSASDVAPAAPTAPDETLPATAGDNPFLRFLLLIFILGAIFFLGRLFFERWGDGEDGERPSPVETTTDLGKIRFPPGTEVRGESDDHGAVQDEENGGRPGD